MRRRRVVVLLMVTACGPGATGTKPPPPPPGSVAFTNPAAVSLGIATMESTFAARQLQSLQAMAPLLAVPSSAPAPGPSAPAGAPTMCGPSAPAKAASRTAPVSPTATMGVFPDSDWGRVFAYDSATASYRRSSDSSGPANGVRFLLYGITSGNQPSFPLTEIGYLDLLDQTSGGPVTLQGAVDSGATHYATFSVLPSGTQGAYTEILAGNVTNGGHTMAFRDSTTRFDLEVTAGATASDAGAGYQMVLNANRTTTDAFDNFYSLDYTFTHANQAVRVQGSISTFCLLPSIGLTISVNDTNWALVTNGTTGPTYTRLDGDTLTTAQRAAVTDLIRGQGELFNWLEKLSLPGTRVLGP